MCQGNGSLSYAKARMGIVAGVYRAEGGSTFSGKNVTFEAATSLDATLTGVPICGRAGMAVSFATGASRNWGEGASQACCCMQPNQ